MVLQLCTRDDPRCPSYSKEDYPYIQRGFIISGYSIFDAFGTYWRPNNETANVFTQLAGLLVQLWMVWVLWQVPLVQLVATDRIGSSDIHDRAARRFWVTIILIGSIICCTSSLITHMYQARSAPWHRVLSICDWSGTLIVTLAVAIATDNVNNDNIIDQFAPHSIRPLLHFCSGHAHLTAVVSLLVATVLVLTFMETTHLFRFSLVFIVIIVTCLPAVLLSYSINFVVSFLGTAAFGAGGILFGTHYPERAIPRVFDILCPSHSLWHIGYLCGLTLAEDVAASILLGKSPWWGAAS